MGSIIIIAIVSLLFSAFFSGMEIAFTGANKLKLELDRKKRGVFGFVVDKFTDNPSQYITTILVGNNIALVIYSTYMTLLMHALATAMRLPVTGNVVIETIISTIIIVIVGEYTPKSVVRINPNFYLKLFIVPLYLIYIILWPLAKLTTWLSFLMLRVAGVKINSGHQIRSFGKVDLEHLLEQSSENEHEQENEITIFKNALEFSDKRVRDCMVPRVDVEAVDEQTSVEELRNRFVESNFSRIFVWRDSIDNIIGYVNIKSLFRAPKTLKQTIIKVDYVPETMYAEQLLERFTKSHSSVAVVIDEFGGTAGIISLEDVLEEIFGEIEDEHDVQSMVERQTGEGEWLFSCRLEIDYLNDKYDLAIPESEEYDTLAGYILSNRKEIPRSGELFTIDNKQIRIVKSSSSRIDLAKVKIL